MSTSIPELANSNIKHALLIDLQIDGEVKHFYLDTGYSKSKIYSNSTSIYIPPGFAHGFVTLKKENIVCYSCTEYRSSNYERSLKYNDSKLKIKWPVKKPNISIKDKNANNFDYYLNNFFS